MNKKNEINKISEFLSNTTKHPIINRRDFLSRWGKGIFSASLCIPEFSFSQEETVDLCTSNMDQNLASTLIIDLIGGGHLIGSNFIVSKSTDGNQLGDLDYDARGLGVNDNDGGVGLIKESNINTDLGIALHANSGILQGIQTILNNSASPSTYYQSVDGAILCSKTLDDTNNNIINPLQWICNAGCVGSFGTSIGNKTTKSGGNSITPVFNSSSKNFPTPLVQESNLIKLLQISRLGNKLSTDKQKKLLKLIEDLNLNSLEQRSDKFSNSLKNRLHCDYKIPMRVLTDPKFSLNNLRIPNNGFFDQTFNLVGTNSTLKNFETFKLFGHLLTSKFFGVGTIGLSGFDYHDGTRLTGDSADKELGINLGGLIKACVDAGKNLFVVIITDGGVGVDLMNANNIDADGRINWVADRGTASAAVLLAINGSGKSRPTMRSHNNGHSIRQIGRVDSQSILGTSYKVANIQVDTKTKVLTTNGSVGLVSGIFANYLALHGIENKLGEFAGIDVFSTSSGGSSLDEYLVFDHSFYKG